MSAASAPHSPVCPYCRGTVSADLARSGGNCPHCMLEIPGEEAPTDPGLEAKKRQEAEAALAHKRATTRNRVIGALVLLVACGAGGYGWMRHKAAQEELVYELGDVYMAPAAKVAVAAADPVAPKVDDKGTKAGSGSAKRPDVFATPDLVLKTAPEGGDPSPTGTVKFVPGSSGQQDLAVTGSGSGGPQAISIGGADITAKRLNTTVLETDEEILAMAKEVTAAYQPQIQTCVEQKLKLDEGFKGTWKVAYTIQTDGTVSNISTTAKDKADAELESCMQRAIARWKYQRIAHEFKVKKSYNFSGTGW